MYRHARLATKRLKPLLRWLKSIRLPCLTLFLMRQSIRSLDAQQMRWQSSQNSLPICKKWKSICRWMNFMNRSWFKPVIWRHWKQKRRRKHRAEWKIPWNWSPTLPILCLDRNNRHWKDFWKKSRCSPILTAWMKALTLLLWWRCIRRRDWNFLKYFLSVWKKAFSQASVRWKKKKIWRKNGGCAMLLWRVQSSSSIWLVQNVVWCMAERNIPNRLNF